MKQNETKFQKDLRQALEAEVGGFWWKVHGGMFQMTGLPDICGCVRGLYIAIETKAGNNKLSEVQKTRMKQLREAGALAFSCWADDPIKLVVKRVKKYVEKHALQGTEESRTIIRKAKGDRVIHGARDWEDHHIFRSGRSKTKKDR